MSRPSASPRYRDYVRHSLAQRVPAILRIAADGQDGAAVAGLAALAGAIAANAPMRLAPDELPLPGWEDLPGAVDGLRPSEAAFFDFEFWLYARIAQAVGFGRTGNDPFRATKHRDLDRHLAWAGAALEATAGLPAALALALDANAHDLSQLGRPAATIDLGRDLLRIDAAEVSRLNIIADNFGGEFVADLVLAVIAAEAGIETALHVKRLPMFVSDTTEEDVALLLEKASRSNRFGARLHAVHDAGRLRLAAHPFWSAPLFLDRLPIAELGQGPGVLNVLKGDLNFRRAVGDACVAVDTPFAALDTLPVAPMLALRSIKSYCAAGMAGWPSELSREDFPKDGTIVVVQRIPGRATACA